MRKYRRIVLPPTIALMAACASSPGEPGGSGDGTGSSSGTSSGATSGSTGASGTSGGSSSGTSTGGTSGSSSGGSSGSGSGTSSGASSGSSSGASSGSSLDASSGASSGSSSDASSGSSSDASSSGGSTGKKFVGNISTSGAIRSDFVTYWNQFTPENEGKWGSVEATQGTYNWAPLDAEYKYTQSNNVIFKHHNFVWGNQQPSWTSSLTTSNGPSTIQAWMNAVCTRYPKVKFIDVVNEPSHNQPPYMNAIGGAGSSGYDWVVNAFKWARTACPNAILIMNDYNTIEYQTDHNNFIKIAKAIKAAGAPIDAVGAQGHAAYNFSAATVQNFIDDLATQTGLPVYITEYDINVADDTQQSQIMQSQFTMFWNDTNVQGITLWGYIEGATWETNTGLMTSSGTMRPAMTWLVNFLKTH